MNRIRKELRKKYGKYLTKDEDPVSEFNVGSHMALATNKRLIFLRKFPRVFIPVPYKSIANIEHYVYILWGELFRAIILLGVSAYGYLAPDSFMGIIEGILSFLEKNVPEFSNMIAAISAEPVATLLLIGMTVLGLKYLLSFALSLSGKLKVSLKGAPSVRIATSLSNDVRNLIKLVETLTEGEEGYKAVLEEEVTRLEPGQTYLVKEYKPEKSFKLFLGEVDGGCRGLYLSRTNPDQLDREHKENLDFNLLKGMISVYWLTDSLTTENSISPEPDQLFAFISDYIEKNYLSVILFDGLEYLISHANFEQVLCFIQGVKDKVGLANCRFIVPISPQALTEKEMALLEREMSKVL